METPVFSRSLYSFRDRQPKPAFQFRVTPQPLIQGLF